MQGLFLISGTADAHRTVQSSLSRMSASEQLSFPVRTNERKSAAFGVINADTQTHLPPLQDRFSVLVDGEIYDETGLKADLAAYILKLHLQKRHTDICSLNGSFAICLYDHEENTAHLYSDRLGTRTLYAVSFKNGFAVSSRVNAFPTEIASQLVMDEEGIMELFTNSKPFGNRTIWKGISKLSGGDYLQISTDRLLVQKTRPLCWSTTSLSQEQMSEAIAEAVNRAARRRLNAPGRARLFMSGGLDSRTVLAATRNAGKILPCLSVGMQENDEIRLAEKVSNQAGAGFHFHRTDIDQLVGSMSAYSKATDCLFPGPSNLFGTYRDISETTDWVFSGHGLDVLFRGILLPKRSLKLGRSVTALPSLGNIEGTTPADVLFSAKTQIPGYSRSLFVQPSRQPKWEEYIRERSHSLCHSFELNGRLENAYDAIALESLCHYTTNSDYYAMSPHMDFRNISHDSELLDLYLSMPPEWRIGKSVMIRAMQKLAPDLMELPDANTMYRAAASPWSHIGYSYYRAAMRKIRLQSDPRRNGDGLDTGGSWMSWSNFFRRTEKGKAFLAVLPELENATGLGLFHASGLEKIAEEHTSGRRDHTKFIMQALTVLQWTREKDIA
ncbi:asparagine synthase-related protein [Kiloniella sp. b19]|uniref:asparagine synthase-related protein n=1 Tax=Kiloniella sp. GXU_MW_B19 TaxID=3141326 RepID=UPI0031E47946